MGKTRLHKKLLRVPDREGKLARHRQTCSSLACPSAQPRQKDMQENYRSPQGSIIGSGLLFVCNNEVIVTQPDKIYMLDQDTMAIGSRWSESHTALSVDNISNMSN